ncbi:unnamed protein product [Nesidiocoris tenuis]|uniref:Reverse transcriptase domain-containing protein n=1 Tax=Nesidiocoris tenuis TaxID=355587 RepID=A0A6H5H2J8_9HEMI|nr:unnamed protein product [Nesidiocoris tenuis]
MTFGLRNAGQTFQRFINEVLCDLDFVFVFLDDILNRFFVRRRAQTARLQSVRTPPAPCLNPAKCLFGFETLSFLGFQVSADGIRPLPDCINALVQSERPTTCDQLRRFLGTLNYYRRFVKRSSWPQAIIHDYLAKKKNKHTIDWTLELENVYEKCKADLANATLLVH